MKYVGQWTFSMQVVGYVFPEDSAEIQIIKVQEYFVRNTG